MEINPNTLEIEIVSVTTIDGGVQVLARAWSDGQQIGFGSDGTVDIERFRIFNPPILVPDENGNIIQEYPANEELGIPATSRRLREDPEAAILSVLVETIKVMKNVHDSSSIIPGKIGNTTSTFYPAAGATSPVDGYVGRGTAQNETWSTLRTSTGNRTDVTAANENCVVLRQSTTTNNWNWLQFSVFLFDTSVIGSDTIVSATLSLNVANVGANTLSFTPQWNIAGVTPASNSSLANGDYNQLGSTEFSTAVNVTGQTLNAYTDMALNSSGLSYINKAGITAFAAALTNQITNTTPTHSGTANLFQTFFNCYFADQTGTSQDPKLVVEHNASVRKGAILSFF